MRPKAKILLLVSASFVLALAAVCGKFIYREWRVAKGFDAVQISDSEERVLELLGPPNEIASCGKPPFKWDNCNSVFVYYTFLERRSIYVDDNNRVIEKVYNVSP
jgi:hypothetical protein